MDFKNICEFWFLIKTHDLLMCNIIKMMPYNGCSHMLRISLKTEKNILLPTPDACGPLLALRSIQLMNAKPRPRHSALQLLGESGACGYCNLVRGALTRHWRFLVVASQSGFMLTRMTMPPTGIGGGNHAKLTTYHCTNFVISNSLGHNLTIGTMIFSWQVLFNL